MQQDAVSELGSRLTGLLPDLAAEANHRIANSLAVLASLLRMQCWNLTCGNEPMGAKQVRQILEEMGGRIETVGRLHRLLASAGEAAEIDLADYLNDVATSMVSALSAAGQCRLVFAADCRCIVPVENALPLGLVVGEALTNALKYAHPARVTGKIAVTCRRDPSGAIRIEVVDDGVGLPEGFDPATSGCLGFRIMRLLGTQLGARIAFDSTPLGLAVRIELPAR